MIKDAAGTQGVAVQVESVVQVKGKTRLQGTVIRSGPEAGLEEVDVESVLRAFSGGVIVIPPDRAHGHSAEPVAHAGRRIMRSDRCPHADAG